MRKCAFCGTENTDTGIFCEFCGHRLNATQSSIATVPQISNVAIPLTSTFNRGYVTEQLITDADSKEIVLSDVYVFITDKENLDIYSILPLLEETAKNKCQLLIVADSFDENTINTLVVNRQRGTLICAAVNAPGFGERRKEMLKDIAILTGGEVVTSDSENGLHGTTLAHCGKAKMVRITEDDTFIIEGNGNPDRINERIAQLKEYMSTTISLYDKEKTEERLVNLFGLTTQ